MPPRLQLTTFFRLAEILKHHVRYTRKSIVVGQIPKTQKQKNKKNPPKKSPKLPMVVADNGGSASNPRVSRETPSSSIGLDQFPTGWLVRWPLDVNGQE
jgi:hypothetical protein